MASKKSKSQIVVYFVFIQIQLRSNLFRSNLFSAEHWIIATLRAAILPSGSSLDHRQIKPVKIETIFNGRAQEIFSNKETIFAGFASLLIPLETMFLTGLTQREPLPTPCRASRGRAGGQKISSPSNPLHFFARLLDGMDFFGGFQ